MPAKPGFLPEMDAPDRDNARLEARLRQITAAFPYPATPDLAARERQRLAARPGRQLSQRRRLAAALAAVLLLMAAALLASPVRAQVLDWLRIGAVRIFFNQPSPTPTLPAATAPASRPPPTPTPTFLQSVLDLSGETSLADAGEQAGFSIVLPTYPDDLGAPEHIFLQQFEQKAVMLVWMVPGQPGQVRMSLTEASSATPMFEKYNPQSVMDTKVNNVPAVWIDGNYLLVTSAGGLTMMRLIDQGHTLIWNDGKMTFRLETDAALEEAVKSAESLR